MGATDTEKGDSAHGRGLPKGFLRLILWLLVPFCIVWLVLLAVLSWQKAPILLLAYPVAGIAVLLYRCARRRPSRGRKHAPNQRIESDAAGDSEGREER